MSDKGYAFRTLGEYQGLMERFENYADPFILPDLRLIVRLDARRSGAFWESEAGSGYPYAPTVQDALVGAAAQLMRQSINMQFGFVHGDEISLLLARSEGMNPRRRSRLVSILASAAALSCQQDSGVPLLFHARLSELPSDGHVLDYFFWQRRVASRNLITFKLSAHFAQKGLSAQEIDARVGRLPTEERFALAAREGLAVSAFSAVELRGSALIWRQEGAAPKNLSIVSDIPDGDERYLEFLRTHALTDGASSEPMPPEKPRKERFKLSPQKK